MKGAREYAKLFKTGKYGRLYFEVGAHARGKTFEIYILPKMGKEDDLPARFNINQYPDKLLVYGAVSGQLGWTEVYDWIHKGDWCNDFYQIVNKRKEQLKVEIEEKKRRERSIEEKRKERLKELIDMY